MSIQFLSASIAGVDEGISSVVERLLGSDSGIVIKKFKAPSSTNPLTMVDYKNEVAVLTVLERHSHALPVEIPRILDHGVYEGAQGEDPVAYIKMTAIEAPLSRIDYRQVTEADNEAAAREIGKVMGALHSLRLSDDDRMLLTRNPVDCHLGYFRLFPLASDRSRALIDALEEKLRGMEGPKVLVHEDPYIKNFFGSTVGTALVGMCDFCYSGLGVPEIDIYHYLGKHRQKEAYLKGYLESGGQKPSEKNLDVMNALRILGRKINQDHELMDAFDKIGLANIVRG